MNLSEPVGLCSSIALQHLSNAVREELESYEAKLQVQDGLRSHLRGPIRWSLTTDSLLHWTSANCILIGGLLLGIAAAFSEDRSLIVESAVIVLLFVFNVCVARWNGRVRQMEVVNHAKDILNKLSDLLACEVHWPKELYKPLFGPISQSITEQWTYRDGHLVNLPTSLLVEGDVILLRPGQVAPTDVCQFDDSFVKLHRGEKYQPASFDTCSNPTVRQPLKPQKYTVSTTPYIPYLRTCLQQARSRPSPVLEIKRIVCTTIIERWVLPIVLGVSFIVNVLRFVFSDDSVGSWPDMIIRIQVNTVVPLMSLSVPILWIVLTSYGNARIVTLFHNAKHKQSVTNATDYSHDVDELNGNLATKEEALSCVDLWEHFRSAVLGPSSHLPRSASLLFSLGTMTSLCCVDKRGILSYPDPTIEKVFFMSNLQDDDPDGGTDGGETDAGSDLSVFMDEPQPGEGKKGVTIAMTEKHEDYFPEHHAEVLTLSMDSTQNPTSLQFDETNWERHLNSLKPMGLNILLNTCNPGTVERYSHFVSHVHSIVNPENCTQPAWVVHRRCMCQLAYLMGFTEQATQVYNAQQQLALYQAMQSDSEDGRTCYLHTTRSFIKKRTPVPHLLSVLIQDSLRGTNQLLTEGTAELVLSLCTDFWDGSDLCSLEDTDRKKILDFYQRATLSSYCSALSYQPMAESVAQYFDDLYIELPANTSRDGKLPADVEGIGLTRSSWDVDMTTARQQTADDANNEGKGRKYHSLDSTMDRTNRIKDAKDCYRAQCGQIFIGMVTTNYQAKADVVRMIEKLDHLCIRFVHFSRDQELRSKVFSEKMGLEAGWNCHISLQSETSGAPLSPTNVTRHLSERSSSVKTEPSEGAANPSDRSEDLRLDYVHLNATWHGGHDKCETGVTGTTSSCVKRTEIGNGTGDNGDGSATENASRDKITMGRNDQSESCDRNDEDGKDDDDESSVLCRLLPLSPLPSPPNPKTSQSHPESNVQSHRFPSPPLSYHSTPADSSAASRDERSQLLPLEDSHLPRLQVSVEDGKGSPTTGPGGQSPGFLSEEMVSLRSKGLNERGRLSEDIETLSHITESETAGGFDISNRAKLPRGIENIRPHLENVDNVPLLVPLFTDVTPETTQEMLTIMQDYGEVVCCLGSSVNIANMPLFAQANISIGVEPMYPHTCLHSEETVEYQFENGPRWQTPMGLSSLLNSLPCSLAFWRNHNLSLVSLIREARGLCTAFITVFTFLMFALLSLTTLQLFASMFLLPPPLSGVHVLWLTVVVAPALSVSLINSQHNPQTMTNATGKNLGHKDYQVIQLYIFYFFARFLLTTFILLVCHALTLYAFCQKASPVVESCHFIFGNRNDSTFWNGLTTDRSNQLGLAQNLQALFTVLYLVVASASYVHNLKPLWKKHPFTNRLWCSTVLIVLFLQIVYFLLDVKIWTHDPAIPQTVTAVDVPVHVWLVALLWPAVILVLGEAVKLVEIRFFVRWQRRNQLQFGTKLGMNSPF